MINTFQIFVLQITFKFYQFIPRIWIIQDITKLKKKKRIFFTIASFNFSFHPFNTDIENKTLIQIQTQNVFIELISNTI